LRILGQNSKKTDLELVNLYQQSLDSSYLGELFTRYSSFVLAVSMKYLKDEEKSKDAVMDIFEKLTIDLKTQELQYFKSWLFSVVRNHCLMILRSDKSKQAHWQQIQKEQEFYMENSANMHQNNEEKHINKSNVVEKAVESLKDDQKKCIKLFFYEEKSYQEIVDITGLNMKEVKSHLQNGKRNLQNLLEAEYKKMKES